MGGRARGWAGAGPTREGGEGGRLGRQLGRPKGGGWAKRGKGGEKKKKRLFFF
jgi:hypothetical protein